MFLEKPEQGEPEVDSPEGQEHRDVRRSTEKKQGYRAREEKAPCGHLKFPIKDITHREYPYPIDPHPEPRGKFEMTRVGEERGDHKAKNKRREEAHGDDLKLPRP